MFGYYSILKQDNELIFTLKGITHFWGYENSQGNLIYDFLKSKRFFVGSKCPVMWHFCVKEELDFLLKERLPSLEINGEPTLIIDIKPSENSEEVFIVELFDIWGWTNEFWTNILYNCKILIEENRETFINKSDNTYEVVYKKLIKNSFHLSIDKYNESKFIFSFNSINARFFNNEIRGTVRLPWSAPANSSANSVLLWNEPLSYFRNCLQEADLKYHLF